ncbi:MAG: Hsp20/alpha crystallin family protein [Flavobacteriales bacterium]|nr:Hsp20/alpha crystallin family protein [Flavobacteriales bacterium]
MFPTKFRPATAFRLFDDALTREFFHHPHRMRWANVPSVNVKESAESFDLEFAVPGFKKEDFSVNLENDVLTIGVKKESEQKENKEGYSRREWYLNAFTRSFSVPEDVVKDAISATYENGILCIVLPRNNKEAKIENKKTIVVA